MTIFICKVLIFFQMLILLLQYLEWIEFSATHVDCGNEKCHKTNISLASKGSGWNCWPKKDCGSRYSVPIKKKTSDYVRMKLKVFRSLRTSTQVTQTNFDELLAVPPFIKFSVSLSSPLCLTASLPSLSHCLSPRSVSLSPLSLPSLSHCLSPLSVPLSPSPLCLTVSLPYLPIFLALSHISLSCKV